MSARHVLAYLLSMLACSQASADELVMKNGSRLIGKLVSASQSDVVFDTPFAGQISIKQANISRIVADQKVTLMMQDGSVYREKQIVSKEQRLLVMAEDEQPVVFDVADIKLVNPEPWRIGDGYKWFGQINTAINYERGNTDTDELDLDFETIWRSLEDRYTIRGAWEIDEVGGTKNKDTSRLRGKYDRFSADDPDNYLGFQLAFERDEFADLDLRTTVGPYVGRQFFETRLLTLHAELGVVHVDEQFDVAADDDYWGSNWELRLSSEIIPGMLLYALADGVVNFTHRNRNLVNASMGISLPIIYGLKAGAEVTYAYNGGAVEGVDDLDETYNVKFGYAW